MVGWSFDSGEGYSRWGRTKWGGSDPGGGEMGTGLICHILNSFQPRQPYTGLLGCLTALQLAKIQVANGVITHDKLKNIPLPKETSS